MLAGEIIAGGKGHWGEIPVTPHPGPPLADAKEMTQYTLSGRETAGNQPQHRRARAYSSLN